MAAQQNVASVCGPKIPKLLVVTSTVAKVRKLWGVKYKKLRQFLAIACESICSMTILSRLINKERSPDASASLARGMGILILFERTPNSTSCSTLSLKWVIGNGRERFSYLYLWHQSNYVYHIELFWQLVSVGGLGFFVAATECDQVFRQTAYKIAFY